MDGGKKSRYHGEGADSDPSPDFPAPGARPFRSGEIVSRQIAGETIIVPIKSSPGELNDIFTLNELASSVWDLIDGDRSISDISMVIASEYDVAPDQALEDTRELIAQFTEATVISLDPAES